MNSFQWHSDKGSSEVPINLFILSTPNFSLGFKKLDWKLQSKNPLFHWFLCESHMNYIPSKEFYINLLIWSTLKQFYYTRKNATFGRIFPSAYWTRTRSGKVVFPSMEKLLTYSQTSSLEPPFGCSDVLTVSLILVTLCSLSFS